MNRPKTKTEHWLILKAANILERDHIGKKQCMKRSDMAQFLFKNRTDAAIRETREVIRQAVMEGHAISWSTASNGGYYWIADPSELEESMRLVDSYVRNFMIRRAVLNKAYQRMTGRQYQLPLDLKPVNKFL